MFCSAKLGGKPQEAIQVVAFFSKGFFCGRKLLLLLCLSSVQYDVQFWGQNEEEERFSSSVSSLEFISMSTRLDRLVWNAGKWYANVAFKAALLAQEDHIGKWSVFSYVLIHVTGLWFLAYWSRKRVGFFALHSFVVATETEVRDATWFIWEEGKKLP